jgi:TfoX/Sxy family transcriptional regulator of competence genes
MPWKKNSAEMVQFLDAALSSLPCQRRMMFGTPAYFVNDNMFAGLHEDHFILRLSESDRKALADACDEATQFEPMPGRPMREYMVLPEELYSNPSALEEWLARSFSYVSALPPKAPKAKKKG